MNALQRSQFGVEKRLLLLFISHAYHSNVYFFMLINLLSDYLLGLDTSAHARSVFLQYFNANVSHIFGVRC